MRGQAPHGFSWMAPVVVTVAVVLVVILVATLAGPLDYRRMSQLFGVILVGGLLFQLRTIRTARLRAALLCVAGAAAIGVLYWSGVPVSATVLAVAAILSIAAAVVDYFNHRHHQRMRS